MPREDQRWREQENWRATESFPDLCCKKLQSILILLVKAFSEGIMEVVCECSCILWKSVLLKTLFRDGYHCTKSLEWPNLFHLRRWKYRLYKKCHLGLAGSEGSRASSRTHFTAENVQTTSDVEMLKVKEPMDCVLKVPWFQKLIMPWWKQLFRQCLKNLLTVASYLVPWGILQSVWRRGGRAGNYMEIPWKRHVLDPSTEVWLASGGDGGRLGTVDSFNNKKVSNFIWNLKLGDNHWGKCGLRHSIKPSSSGDCVHKLFMSVQLESCASTVLVLEKHPWVIFHEKSSKIPPDIPLPRQ